MSEERNNNKPMEAAERKEKNKANLKITLTIAGVLLACCLGYIGISLYRAHTNNKLIDNVKSSVSQQLSSLPVSSKEESDSEVVLVENPIDFKELQSGNKDLYAWIEIPNTKVDYPVAQSSTEDDYFYLHHGTDKSYYFAGTIYTEKQNKRDFSDRNTVLYGHNMLDGSMFATLHYFADEEFFEENKYIYIYTPGHILKYEIFAAYEYDDRHLLNSFDFSDDDVWADYVDEINNMTSPYTCNLRGTKVTTEDKIITLSTCTDYRPSNRYLVQGVLVDDKLTK